MVKTRWNFREIISRPTDKLGLAMGFTFCVVMIALVIFMAVTQ